MCELLCFLTSEELVCRVCVYLLMSATIIGDAPGVVDKLIIIIILMDLQHPLVKEIKLFMHISV